MIRTVIRLRNDKVLVFDGKGDQLPEYQGQYEEVKDKIQKAASTGTVFNHWYGYTVEPERVSRENW